jgi:SRSO17 transposase
MNHGRYRGLPADLSGEQVKRLMAELDLQIGCLERSLVIEMSRRIAPLFARPEPRLQAMRYVLGLLGPTTRNNSWQLAETTGDQTPWAMQRLLNRAHWDADEMRDQVRDVLIKRIESRNSVLVLQEAAMPKKGSASVAVARQHTADGRVGNCQIGVFATYQSRRGQAIIDRELYLPPDWTRDVQRCRTASVPRDRWQWRSIGELGRRMVERTVASGSVSWVQASSAFGVDPALRQWLEQRRLSYVIETTPSFVAVTPYGVTSVGSLTGAAAGLTWLGDGCGTEWTWLPVRLRSSVDSVAAAPPSAGFVHAMLLSRSTADGLVGRRYLCLARADTRLARLVAVARAQRCARLCLQQARDRIGIDSYEVRTWPAWYRHVTLSMLAFGCLDAQHRGPVRRASGPLAGS